MRIAFEFSFEIIVTVKTIIPRSTLRNMAVMTANWRFNLELMNTRGIEVEFIVKASRAIMTKWLSRFCQKSNGIAVPLPSANITFAYFSLREGGITLLTFTMSFFFTCTTLQQVSDILRYASLGCLTIIILLRGFSATKQANSVNQPESLKKAIRF